MYVILVACHDVIGNSLTGAGSGLDWSKRDSIKEQRSLEFNTQNSIQPTQCLLLTIFSTFPRPLAKSMFFITDSHRC